MNFFLIKKFLKNNLDHFIKQLYNNFYYFIFIIVNKEKLDDKNSISCQTNFQDRKIFYLYLFHKPII